MDHVPSHGHRHPEPSSWSIDSIPGSVVVARGGKLHSLDARGEFETILPELLERRLEAARDEPRSDRRVGLPASAGIRWVKIPRWPKAGLQRA